MKMITNPEVTKMPGADPDLTMLRRIEVRLEARPMAEVMQIRKPFDASVRQADSIGVGKYLLTARTAIESTTYSAIGNIGALLDAAYDDGALGVTAMVAP